MQPMWKWQFYFLFFILVGMEEANQQPLLDSSSPKFDDNYHQQTVKPST